MPNWILVYRVGEPEPTVLNTDTVNRFDVADHAINAHTPDEILQLRCTMDDVVNMFGINPIIINPPVNG